MGKKNMKKIEQFVAENKEALNDFKGDLDKVAKEDGVTIDWEKVKKEADEYFGDKATKEAKLAQKGGFKLEDAKNVDWENVKPKEVWNWLKENGKELLQKLKERKPEVKAFVKKNQKKIEQFVSENKAELKDFAGELEKVAKEDGVKINWDQVKSEADDYFFGK